MAYKCKVFVAITEHFTGSSILYGFTYVYSFKIYWHKYRKKEICVK